MLLASLRLGPTMLCFCLVYIIYTDMLTAHHLSVG